MRGDALAFNDLYRNIERHDWFAPNAFIRASSDWRGAYLTPAPQKPMLDVRELSSHLRDIAIDNVGYFDEDSFMRSVRDHLTDELADARAELEEDIRAELTAEFEAKTPSRNNAAIRCALSSLLFMYGHDGDALATLDVDYDELESALLQVVTPEPALAQ